MWKKLLLGTAVILALAIGLAWLNRDAIVFALIKSQIAPEQDFADTTPPAAPDYGDLSSWAAHPLKEDLADVRPAGGEIDELPEPVPMFFIHPTTFLDKSGWNQPLGYEPADWTTRERALRHQASSFNACCDVHAPHYRQATAFSFLDRGTNGRDALDLAYGDVKQAFQYFIANLDPAQPFLIAGHSQGSKHGAQLLAEQIAGTPLQERLIAAYLVGFSVAEKTLADTGIAACTSPTDSGCAVGWNTVETGKSGTFDDAQDVLCINPLSWTGGSVTAAHERNTGAIGFPNYAQRTEGEDLDDMVLEAGVADATCNNGRLEVSDIRSQQFPARMPGSDGGLHPYDYGLFYASIRQNAVDRTRAYLAQVIE
jgi:hypothetical protein